MNQRGRGIEGSISQEMLDVMRSADIFMVNNEFPYSDRGTPTENKKFNVPCQAGICILSA